ncbi:hypothetical protein ONE63_003723 [Megalurothrips usitatus]|uniref:WW domain-containing protein n=1 Tax=Megalurothrips usitatus TaxID=439358 RepID=A0AAV7X3X1_9NEOP|nr:hypothetical protein ONE63_003723 [Megalurothrips usitatus]
MSLNRDSGEKQQEVVVERDTESELQALFEIVLKPDSKRPLQKPMSMRKLPVSFFNPPSTGSKSPSVSHSRENSADSAFGTAPPTVSPSGLPVSHPRHHSSPASLQQTYAHGQPPPAVPPVRPIQHIKARSYDMTQVDELGPLPPGWEKAHTIEGQVYFLK